MSSGLTNIESKNALGKDMEELLNVVKNPDGVAI